MRDYHLHFADDDTGYFAQQIIDSITRKKHSVAVARIIRAVFDDSFTAVIDLKDGRKVELRCSSTITERKPPEFDNPFDKKKKKKKALPEEKADELKEEAEESKFPVPSQSAKSETIEEANSEDPKQEENFHGENRSSKDISRLNQLMDGLDVFQ